MIYRAIFFLFLYAASLSEAAVGRTEQKFTDAVTGKSGKYTVRFAPAVRAKSVGALIFFHGSGSTAGYAGIFDALDGVAKGHNLIPVALQAPNNADTWANHQTGPSNRHDEYVKSFIEKILWRGHPEIDPNRTFFVGLSAGSTFLSGDFLPRFVTNYKGGAVLLCGGGGPVADGPGIMTKLPKDAARNFPIYGFIQKKDFLYGQAMQGVEYWKWKGAEVTFETPEGGNHCAFDIAKEMDKGLKVLQKKR